MCRTETVYEHRIESSMAGMAPYRIDVRHRHKAAHHFSLGNNKNTDRLTMLEQEQLSQLTRIRRIATGLLVLMAAIFVAAKFFESRHHFLGFIRAFSEAAM